MTLDLRVMVKEISYFVFNTSADIGDGPALIDPILF